MPNVYTFKDFEGSSHRILLALVRQFHRDRGVLVDLGAAGGELGSALRPDFDETFGFEYDVDRLGQLRAQFDHVVIGDLERVTRLPRANAIIAADVLEHLRDPRHLLEIAREALDGKGTFFVSVPNIANITIRLGLLFGVFTYRDRGILDTTHLRFYTMTTIRRELERNGFEIIAVRGSSVPIRLIVGRYLPDFVIRIGERMLTWITRMWRSLFAYQFVIVARPTR